MNTTTVVIVGVVIQAAAFGGLFVRGLPYEPDCGSAASTVAAMMTPPPKPQPKQIDMNAYTASEAAMAWGWLDELEPNGKTGRENMREREASELAFAGPVTLNTILTKARNPETKAVKCMAVAYGGGAPARTVVYTAEVTASGKPYITWFTVP